MPDVLARVAAAASAAALPTLALDRTFGSGGEAEAAVAGLFSIESQAIALDGGILIGGSLRSGVLLSGPPMVVRLTPAGRLDQGFANGGLLEIPTLEGEQPGARVPAYVAVDAEGRLLVTLRA